MGFDVPMADALGVNVHQTSKNLIGDDFNIEVRHSFLLMLLDVVVKIAVIVRHDDVEVLFIFLVGNVRPQNLHHKITAQHVDHLDFTVFVLAVLENSLDRNNFTSLF